eukprot:scaffold1063_cov128-Isochrysis_galbana.AAC.2
MVRLFGSRRRCCPATGRGADTSAVPAGNHADTHEKDFTDFEDKPTASQRGIRARGSFRLPCSCTRCLLSAGSRRLLHTHVC